MQFYKHYCFDLWQTLIKPDPAFKDDRNCFFYHNLNFGGKPIEEVALIFREVLSMKKRVKLLMPGKCI